MFNFSTESGFTAKSVLRLFLKLTVFQHHFIIDMEHKIGDKKWMKYNLPVSSPNKVRNIPTNANISIALHKDLSVDMRRDLFAFTFPGVAFHYVWCRQVLIVYRRKASNVRGVSNKKLQFWKSFKFFFYPINFNSLPSS